MIRCGVIALSRWTDVADINIVGINGVGINVVARSAVTWILAMTVRGFGHP